MHLWEKIEAERILQKQQWCSWESIYFNYYVPRKETELHTTWGRGKPPYCSM